MAIGDERTAPLNMSKLTCLALQDRDGAPILRYKLLFWCALSLLYHPSVYGFLFVRLMYTSLSRQLPPQDQFLDISQNAFQQPPDGGCKLVDFTQRYECIDMQTDWECDHSSGGSHTTAAAEAAVVNAALRAPLISWWKNTKETFGWICTCV